MNTRKKIQDKLNWQDRQKIKSHVSANPQGDLPLQHYRYKHRSSALQVGPLGGFPSLSLTTIVYAYDVW